MQMQGVVHATPRVMTRENKGPVPPEEHQQEPKAMMHVEVEDTSDDDDKTAANVHANLFGVLASMHKTTSDASSHVLFMHLEMGYPLPEATGIRVKYPTC